MSLRHDIKPKSTTRPGSLAALMEAVAGVGRAAGLTDDPPDPALSGLSGSPSRLNSFALARKAHGELVMRNGFTLDDDGSAANGDLWAVSTEGHEQVYPGIPSVDEIRAYLRDHPMDGQWFGGWHNMGENETHLDHTQLFGHKHTAIMVAQENNQCSIYNIKTGKTFYIQLRENRRYLYNCECGTFWDAENCECPNCGNKCGPGPAFTSPESVNQ